MFFCIDIRVNVYIRQPKIRHLARLCNKYVVLKRCIPVIYQGQTHFSPAGNPLEVNVIPMAGFLFEMRLKLLHMRIKKFQSVFFVT
jgi:hypothetical protein